MTESQRRERINRALNAAEALAYELAALGYGKQARLVRDIEASLLTVRP
ncbi:MAG: hypothetical protein AAB368_09945 [bacterium]